MRDSASVAQIGSVLLDHCRGVWAQKSAPPRRVSPDEVLEIQQWLDHGDPQRDIAATYGISLAAVKRIARARQKPKAPLSLETEAEIWRLRRLGLAVARIAQAVSLPYAVVRDAIMAMPGDYCFDVPIPAAACAQTSGPESLEAVSA